MHRDARSPEQLGDGRNGDAVTIESLRGKLLESNATFEERGRHAVRNAELPAIRRTGERVFHDLVAGPVRLDLDALDGIERVVARPVSPSADVERDVDCAVRVAAAGVELVAVLGDLPALSEAVRDARRVVRSGRGAKEAAVALEDA